MWTPRLLQKNGGLWRSRGGAGGVWKPEAERSLRQNAGWKAEWLLLRRKRLKGPWLLGMMYDLVRVTEAHT